MDVPKTVPEMFSTLPRNGDFICKKTTVVAEEFNQTEEQVRQTFVEKYQQGSISLHTWYGQREWSLQDWLRSGRTEAQFFLNPADSGYVRIRRSPGLLGLMA